MKIRYPIMIPLLLAFALVMIAFVWSDSQQRKTELKDSLSKVSSTVEKLIESEIRADVDVMVTALDSFTRDPELTKSFLAADRKSLSAKIYPAYQRLKTRNEVSHFYVHRLDRTNFLRMHEPEHFDDKIERKTLKDVELTGEPSFGVEQGPTGASVLRVVFPILKNGKRIGYMELGKEFQDIVRKIEAIVGLKALVFADKKAIQKDKWETRNNKSAYEVSWDFHPDQAVMASTLSKIPNELKSLQLSTTAKSGYVPENLQVFDGNQAYNVIVVPYFTRDEKKVADIVLLYDSSGLIQADHQAAVIRFSAATLIIVSLLIFFHLFLGKTEALLQRQQAHLIANSKMASLGEMAGGVAHEINTPLGAVLLNAEIVLKKAESDSPNKEEIIKRARNIVDISHRISKIIYGLKGFSRDAKDDDLQTFSIQSLVSDTLSLCGERFRNRGIQVELGESFFDQNIIGQPTQLSQVLLNLLSNSFDAVQSSDNPWIRIEVQRSSEFFEILVTDSGKGIPANIAEKVFQPFFTTKDIGSGTGLGLSISKGIMQKHGGDLIYDSSNANTRFILRFPIKIVERAAS